MSITLANAEPVAATAPPSGMAWARSQRLVLREFVADDLDLLLQMHRDPRLRAHLVDDYPLHREPVARLFLERIAQIYRRHEGLGIWRADQCGSPARFAGWFNLMPMAERPGDVEIGGRLLPLAWGSGLALEGGEMMLNHACDELRLTRVWGVCHPDNRSAQGILATLGFQPLGVMAYDGAPACHYRIELNAWRDLRNTPRGTRLRRALRALHAGAAAPAEPIEEPTR